MDAPPAIQAYISISIALFVIFSGLICYLLVNLLTKQALLKAARAQLQDYAQNLEKLVAARTAELKASEEKYRRLFESSREAIFVVHQEEGIVLNLNPEAALLLGLSGEEVLRQRFDRFAPSEVLAGGKGWHEQVLQRRDGTSRHVDCVLGPIQYEGTDCWQVICRDVTEKRMLEAQLFQSQKMSDLGQMAAGVAHELNTPLGTIYNSSYFIKEVVGTESPKVQKHFSLIESQIERCRKIIKDLLTFSRAPSPELDLNPTDINRLLEDCLNLVGKEIRSGGVTIQKKFQPIPSLMVDAQRISQVFFNLILNAVQAMPSGGTLTINSSCDGQPGSNPQNDGVKILFEDTGSGMPPNVMSQIFTPFYTTKKDRGGTGLGLSVSYQIIKQFNGELKVDSEPGKGSRFTVSLPVMR